MIALFITKWDFELEKPNATHHFAWRTFIYPIPSTKVLLKAR